MLPTRLSHGHAVRRGQAIFTCCTYEPRRAAANSVGAAAHSSKSVDLWLALLRAAAGRIASQAAEVAADASRFGATLQRVYSPVPAGYPPGPQGDQSINFAMNPLEYLEELSEQYHGTASILLGGERVIITGDKDVAKQVLVDRADVFVKAGTAFFPGKAVTGNGLLVSDGDEWRRQRRLSNPAFRRAFIDKYGDEITRKVLQMMDNKWGAGGRRDVYADFNELTLLVALGALFGAEGSDSAMLQDIVSGVSRAFELLASRGAALALLPAWLPTPDKLELMAIVRQLDKAVYSIIANRRARLAAPDVQLTNSAGMAAAGGNADLLQALLEAQDDDGTGMSDAALRDEVLTLLVAGQETSAIVLAWATALLAAHPAAQTAARAQVQQQLGSAMARPQDLCRLTRVEALALEAMRLYPPAFMLGRCANDDVALAGRYTLTCGTTVLVSPYLLHRNSSSFNCPSEFQPERWLDLRQLEGEDKPYGGALGGSMGAGGAYIPFGAGPRSCIATHFAMMEVVLVLTALLQRYELRLTAPGVPLPRPRPALTLRPNTVMLQVIRL